MKVLVLLAYNADIVAVNATGESERVMMRRWVFLCAAMMTLAACGGTGEVVDAPRATPPPSPAERVSPLGAAPPWIEAGGPVMAANADQARLLGRLDMPDVRSTLFAHTFSPDSTRLAGLNNDRLLAWDLVSGRLLVNNARQDGAYIFYSPDKNELYTLNPSGGVRAYEAERGRLQTTFNGHADFSGAVDYDDFFGWLALGGTDGTVKVWEPLERTSRVTFSAHDAPVTRVAFSPDGALLATAAVRGPVRVWRWQDRELLAELDSGVSPQRLDFSPDGDRLALGLWDAISLWELDGPRYLYGLRTEPGGSDVLAFSPDGRLLVSGGETPDMTIWDASTGDLLARLPGVGGERASVAFSPDGDLLLTSTLDGAVNLWNLTDLDGESVGQGTLASTDAGQRVLAVDWTADGYLMTVIDATGPVYVWGIPLDAVPSDGS